VNAKGKEKTVYRWYATPWEILRQLPGLAGHLKEGVTIFPHFHRPESEAGWKSGNPKAGFPLSHRPECIFFNPKRKESGSRSATLPPPGSFFDEKMLTHLH